MYTKKYLKYKKKYLELKKKLHGGMPTNKKCNKYSMKSNEVPRTYYKKLKTKCVKKRCYLKPNGKCVKKEKKTFTLKGNTREPLNQPIREPLNQQNDYLPDIVSEPKIINVKETPISIIYYKLLFQLLIEYAFIILKNYSDIYTEKFVDALNNFQFSDEVIDGSYNLNNLEYKSDNNWYKLEFIYSILRYHIDNMPIQYKEDVNFFSKNIIKELNKKYNEPLFEEEKYYSIYDSRNYSIVKLNNIIMGHLDDIFLIYTETKLEDKRYHFTSHIFILKQQFSHTKKLNDWNDWNDYTCEFVSIQQSLLLLIGANKYKYKYKISKILFDYIQNLELFKSSYLAYAYAWPKISHILKKHYNFLSIAYKAESDTTAYNINRNHYLPIALTGEKNYYILTFKPSDKFLKDYPYDINYI